MFCKFRPDKQRQINEALENNDWKTYTTLVHALKSTSLSIGGRTLSEAAKQLELSGKRYMDETASAEEKEEALNYMRENNEYAMKLYTGFTDAAKELLAKRKG